MAVDSLVIKIKDTLMSLEVNADAHREEKDSIDIISNYVKTLWILKDFLNQLNSHMTVTDHKEQQSKESHVDCLNSTELKQLVKPLIPHLISTITCHTGLHYWTNKESQQIAKTIIIIILKICNCRSVLELLVGYKEPHPPNPSPYLPVDDETKLLPQQQHIDQSITETDHSKSLLFPNGVIKDLLADLKLKLQRGQWKAHPNAKHALLWSLKHLKHPYVGEYLESFLPPLLMLVDDHESYHKVLGVSGMTHLIRNTNAAELRLYGRADVIFDALKPLLYINEVDIITSIHPCLMHLLPVIVGPMPRKVDSPRKPNITDEVFTIFLHSMQTESKLAVRKAYVSHISPYIELMGIFTVRYLKSLLSVLFDYMEYPDYCGEVTRMTCLKTLCCLMKWTWPRIPHYSDSILKSLLKLVSDLCPENSTIPDKSDVQTILSLVVECLILLGQCHSDVMVRYKELLKDSQHTGLLQCLSDSLASLNKEQ